MYVQFISSKGKFFIRFYFIFVAFIQCFTHARLGLRECQVVSVVCEVYCVLCGRELNNYLVSSCFSLVYLRPHFHILCNSGVRSYFPFIYLLIPPPPPPPPLIFRPATLG